MMRAQADKRTVTLFAHPMCGTCDADRVREQVRDADGMRVWVHVETGEQACDNVVTLHLRDTEHPYHLMPATLTAERADDWAEGDVIVVLPNGQRFTVSEDEAVPANLATPEQDGDQ